MWQQNYTPIAGSLAWSAMVAGLPIFAMLFLLGILRKPAWMASLIGLATAVIVSAAVYGMPAGPLTAAVTYGAAFGLFPIGWVVFSAILLYRITVESGKFELLKNSIGNLTSDRHLQALLIAFSFGAFIEGAAGFGTPVAVAGSHARRPGLHALLCRRHLPAGQHRAGGLRLHRHPHHHPRRSPPACRSTVSAPAWAASAPRSPSSCRPT